MKCADKLIYVAGRGNILIVDYADGDTIHKIGDTIYYQKQMYEVVCVELSKPLIKFSGSVGLVLKILR